MADGRPRLLDLFCGAGGAAMGYARAGFEVVGVDSEPQPNYPFEFHQGDATDPETILTAVGWFDALHASPPCQAHVALSNRWRGAGGLADEREDLIPSTRRLLRETGLPYVIENVVGAPLQNPVRVCGISLGLGAHRHRLFESNCPLMVPPCSYAEKSAAVYGRLDGRLLATRKDGSELRAATREEAMTALGIDWMTNAELAQAIPPIYTELLGYQVMRHVRHDTAASRG